jgi:hypothetical protein
MKACLMMNMYSNTCPLPDEDELEEILLKRKEKASDNNQEGKEYIKLDGKDIDNKLEVIKEEDEKKEVEKETKQIEEKIPENKENHEEKDPIQDASNRSINPLIKQPNEVKNLEEEAKKLEEEMKKKKKKKKKDNQEVYDTVSYCNLV